MKLETQYAKALFAVKSPSVKGLRSALEKRGHLKLLPAIYAEYKKILLGVVRLREYKKITPEIERTRVLLELYRKLVS